MTIKTFWTTFLKIIGLYLLMMCFTVLPQFFSSMLFMTGDEKLEQIAIAIFFLIITLGIYILIIRIFLFKTSWLIDKLKLEKGFSEDRIDFKVSSKSVLKIAIIVMGGLLLIEALPTFCREVFEFFQQKSIFRQNPDSSWLIFYFIKSVVGYILITSSKPLADFIEKKSSVEDEEPVLNE